MCLRALRFKAVFKEKRKSAPISFDFEAAVARLSTLLKIPTVSYPHRQGEDLDAFLRLQTEIKHLYPLVHAHMTRQEIGETGLLFHWQGKEKGPAAVFMAHYDVVPVVEGSWSMPAFEAILKEDVLYGRGSLDTKGTFCGILEACEKLLSENFTPQRDIYLSFSGDEETHGESTPQIVDYFKNHQIPLSFVLDEGGAVIEPLFPGMKGRMAVVGIGEKGQMDLAFTAKGKGGHASGPPKHTTVGILSKAVVRCENHPMKAKLTPPFLKMMDTIGPYGPFPVRLALANLKILSPILSAIGKKNGGEINAMIRTTAAFTAMKGSDVFNAMPAEAMVGANIRYLPEDKPKEILAHYEKVIQNQDVALEVLYDTGAFPSSETNCPEYAFLSSVIGAVWPDAITTPYLMLACSDARHYSKICNKVYRFSAMELTREERKKIHGIDEGLRLSEWKNTLDFYYRMLRQENL